MKPVLTVLFLGLLFLVSFSTQGQNYNIKGKVLERGSENPMEFANVALLDPSDSSLVTGGMTELDGSFDFPAESGDYILRVGFIGYENLYKNISIGNRSVLNVGNLRIRPDAQNLEEVTVEGVQSMFESDIDKRRYNVENSILAQGASASELLATLPSIQVDDEGEISMRGSGDILIYINGRPSNISGDGIEAVLSQFPANSIESVELITNPSSRYDATGVGGIINIILKKDEKLGFNGQSQVSVGTRDKYNANINLNYGGEKVNYFANYSYQNRRLFRESDANRISNIPNLSPILNQDSYGENYNISHLARVGLDYNMTENSTLGFYAQANIRERNGDNILNQRFLNSVQSLDSLFVRENFDTNSSTNFETGITYGLNLDTLGQRIYTSISFATDRREDFDTWNQEFFNSQGNLVEEGFVQQDLPRDQTSNLIVLQFDYIKPFLDGGTFETGLKGTLSEWDRSQRFFQADANTSFLPQEIDSISNTFNFVENVYAAYVNYNSRVGKFGYQAGLRAEYTETTSISGNQPQPFVNNYFDWFPSLYATYNIKDEEEFIINYSRRISRPRLWGLTPFYRVNDPLNLQIGNPMLMPEYTNSFEFGYQKGWTNYLLSATVYQRFSTDVQSRIIELFDNNVSITTRENAARRNNTGLEVINQIQLADWWDATLTGNFFYSEIIADNLERPFVNSNFSWTVNLLTNIVIPKIANFQMQANYRGPIVLPQGEIEPLYSVNAGVKRNVLNDRGTISLNVSDIFNTQVFRIRTEDPRFDQTRLWNRETRIGTIAFTYRFGGFKDRNGREERGREDSGEDMDF
ncbi:outer membrane beta-barrel family protein [Mongoliibacter ruber]|uniref:Outer membrane receptor protein involved in Fe transport n=1 Tax=Mongoliibacter ruber TaxID=1750599 RepID=A0A2T0WR13_9BACT|nr:outer membrane beta-barrel family protein [Mongoliibacter ruber]PRY89148.1 outer membrane receptor protein involved in Fe transport [Mongoliibacter ruber]